MKRIFICFLLAAICQSLMALDMDRTLRVDYIFSGTDRACEISLAHLYSIDGWAGKRSRMAEVPVEGNGQISMKDASTGEVLYRQSFSTLFQEWQNTEEATRVRKGFENVFLLPMPSAPVEITVELYDSHRRLSASCTHPVDPSDILIRPAGDSPFGYEYLLRSGTAEECIDVVIVAEGYTESERGLFLKDAEAALRSIAGHEPFSEMMDRFNFIAVPLVSSDSGVSIPDRNEWRSTALDSNFDTFYSDRYLTTTSIFKLHDKLAGIPYEHIIILANTDNYGGGGIYNSYTLTTAHHKSFEPVVVHEFGHSFAGLADEYYYDDQYSEYYYPDAEPWEQNITTKFDFSGKWQDMIDAGVRKVGLFEGAGYQSKGVWRGAKDCRMKTNTADGFCPVCQRAVRRMIEFYTGNE